MLEGVRAGKGVNLLSNGVLVLVAVKQESAQLCRGLAVGQFGGRVNFHAIAGGKDDGLAEEAPGAQLAQSLGNGRLGKGEAFPHGDGRGTMAQAEDEQRHAARICGRARED